MILENVIRQASQLLKNNNIASYELDSEIILSDIMKVSREFLIVNNRTNISKNIIKKYGLSIKKSSVSLLCYNCTKRTQRKTWPEGSMLSLRQRLMQAIYVSVLLFPQRNLTHAPNIRGYLGGALKR